MPSDKGILVWSFAELKNMDIAIEAIRTYMPLCEVRGQIDGNVYCRAYDERDANCICRGVAFAMKDESIR